MGREGSGEGGQHMPGGGHGRGRIGRNGGHERGRTRRGEVRRVHYAPGSH